MNRLQNRVVVVTGGAQGIGEAIALRAAQEGAQVVLWDLRDEAIEAATARIGGAVPGARVSGRAVDVADGNAVRDAAAAVIDAHGRIDGLVNNAGIVADAQLKKMSDAQFDRVIAINLKAKAGVIGMTKTWAKELGRKGVRANAVCPGFIATPILQSMPQNVIDSMVAHVPMGRMGRPDEIAAACAFLLSDDASYVNGAVLEVSGGIGM